LILKNGLKKWDGKVDQKFSFSNFGLPIYVLNPNVENPSFDTPKIWVEHGF
jgi:hypothetical protein